jgi:anti-sigma B factor antagonist
MSVKLTTHQKGEVIIVDTSGKLTLGEGTNTLRMKIRELVEGGSRRIVLNMADVTYTTITRAGGEMKLLNLGKRVHDLLKLTKLYTVFETFEDETSTRCLRPAGMMRRQASAGRCRLKIRAGTSVWDAPG